MIHKQKMKRSNRYERMWKKVLDKYLEVLIIIKLLSINIHSGTTQKKHSKEILWLNAMNT